jgi:methionine aminotransferase
MHLTSKLPDVGLTIFSVMTNLANESGAINLSQGFPDFDVPPALVSLVEKYMKDGHNQYAPMPGVLPLRERLSEKVEMLYGRKYDPGTEITITSGATEALFAAITATVHRNDEVIIFEPAYDSYVPAIQLNGGIPIFLKLKFPDYHIDWDEVKDAVSDNTRAIILNFPHNPTGRVLTQTDIQALIEIVENRNLFIISDEVYEHIIFDNLRHESMAGYPELATRSFVISSFGKTYHATGWKTACCLAPPNLTRELQKIHQFLTFSTHTPTQLALAEFMQNKDAYLNLSPFYQKQRDTFLSSIKNSRFKPIPCMGTYFQMVDYSAISDQPDTQFCRQLTIENGVAAIPPSVFYHDNEDHHVLRFCFAKKDETLLAAGEKLCRV